MNIKSQENLRTKVLESKSYSTIVNEKATTKIFIVIVHQGELHENMVWLHGMLTLVVTQIMSIAQFRTGLPYLITTVLRSVEDAIVIGEAL